RTFAAVPTLPVALCHAGSPMDFSKNGIAEWQDGIRALSEQPQIVCKLSGFGMFNHNWTVRDIAPLVEFCIETFGASRCMFGSNFPVDKLYRDYAGVFAAYAEIVAVLDAQTRNALFMSNANRFYRLGIAVD
ncbi:MAG: amidohydrolase family protein, partial [Pseudomonadota bacterium]